MLWRSVFQKLLNLASHFVQRRMGLDFFCSIVDFQALQSINNHLSNVMWNNFDVQKGAGLHLLIIGVWHICQKKFCYITDPFLRISWTFDIGVTSLSLSSADFIELFFWLSGFWDWTGVSLSLLFWSSLLICTGLISLLRLHGLILPLNPSNLAGLMNHGIASSWTSALYIDYNVCSVYPATWFATSLINFSKLSLSWYLAWLLVLAFFFELPVTPYPQFSQLYS